MIKTFLFNINEINSGHVKGYIAKLGEKGFHGDITPLTQNTIPSVDFNADYETLYPIYENMIGKLSYIEGFFERLNKNLYVNAFKTDEIEKRHFKFQPDLLIEDIKKFSGMLREDLNILKGFEKNRLIDSLEGLYQNKKNLGQEDCVKIIKEYNNLKTLLAYIHSIFDNFFIFFDIDSEDGSLILRNNYLKITYSLDTIKKNVDKRQYEVSKDEEILKSISR